MSTLFELQPPHLHLYELVPRASDVVVLMAMTMLVMKVVVVSGRVVALEPIDEVGRHHDVAAGLVGRLAVVGGVVADLVGPRHQFVGDVLHVGLHVHPITPT